MKNASLRLKDEPRVITAPEGTNLFELLRREGLAPDSYCGGRGSCGKCRVLLNGTEVLACRTVLSGDGVLEIPGRKPQPAADALYSGQEGVFLAFDIGTTTLVGYLLDRTGRVLAACSEQNPQMPYGADVVSRLRSAVAEGSLAEQSRLIREGVSALSRRLGARPELTERICLVGNPTMQQLFFGIPCDNLIRIPFEPYFRETACFPAADYLSEFSAAKLYTLPDFAGYVGADTCACALSEGLSAAVSEPELLVDIGTNGEMVLAVPGGLWCTATAAGPALEGAGISCGMRAGKGAIDRVRAEESRLVCHRIGEEDEPFLTAAGICGCGLTDAVAAALELGLLDRRGRLLNGPLALADGLFLNQEDIRAFMMAKGAIAAGIELLCAEAGIALSDIARVRLAGAFGSFLDPESACRVGLLPKELRGRVSAVGNAAGRGACLFVTEPERFASQAAVLSAQMKAVELASLPGFRRSFAKNMMLEP